MVVLDRLQPSIDEAFYTRRRVTVLFLDLDAIKHINDRYGRDCGDLLLQHLATPLLRCVAPGDMVARLGGHQFIIILPRIRFHLVAGKVATRIFSELSQPLALGDRARQSPIGPCGRDGAGLAGVDQ